jgi:hypothetical protein
MNVSSVMDTWNLAKPCASAKMITRKMRGKKIQKGDRGPSTHTEVRGVRIPLQTIHLWVVCGMMLGRVLIAMMP